MNKAAPLYRIHWVCVHPDWRVEWGSGAQSVPWPLAVRWRDTFHRVNPDMLHWIVRDAFSPPAMREPEG